MRSPVNPRARRSARPWGGFSQAATPRCRGRSCQHLLHARSGPQTLKLALRNARFSPGTQDKTKGMPRFDLTHPKLGGCGRAQQQMVNLRASIDEHAPNYVSCRPRAEAGRTRPTRIEPPKSWSKSPEGRRNLVLRNPAIKLRNCVNSYPKPSKRQHRHVEECHSWPALEEP